MTRPTDAVATPPSSRRRARGVAPSADRAVRLGLLLAGPVGWLVVAYLGSLVVLFLNAFWSRDPFTGLVDPRLHPRQLRRARRRTRSTGRSRCGRSAMAAAVTLTCVVLAFPIAYYMARVASPRVRGLLVVAVLMPLWASYLVKVYAWRLILAEDGVLELGPRAARAQRARATATSALWLVFTYLWLPYMILPIYAGLERIPESLLEASSDLGGRGWMTFRRVDPAARRPGASWPARSSRSR